jgi:hypothetical protein
MGNVLLKGNFNGADVSVGVDVGADVAVKVGGIDVAVGGMGVDVGGTGVTEGGMGVAVGVSSACAPLHPAVIKTTTIKAKAHFNNFQFRTNANPLRPIMRPNTLFTLLVFLASFLSCIDPQTLPRARVVNFQPISRFPDIDLLPPSSLI